MFDSTHLNGGGNEKPESDPPELEGGQLGVGAGCFDIRLGQDLGLVNGENTGISLVNL